MPNPTDTPAAAMLKQSRRASCSSIAQAMPYERNERTYVQPLTLSSYLTLRTARRGVARFRRIRVVMTCATRSQNGGDHA